MEGKDPLKRLGVLRSEGKNDHHWGGNRMEVEGGRRNQDGNAGEGQHDSCP